MAWSTKLSTDLVEVGGAAVAGAGIKGVFKALGGNPDGDHANVILASLGVGALALLGSSNIQGMVANFLQGVSGGAIGVAGWKLYDLATQGTAGRVYGRAIGRPFRTASPVTAFPVVSRGGSGRIEI